MSDAKPGCAVVISGPSAVGKSTLVKRLLTVPRRRLSVSVTTRLPRQAEVEGVHYRFVDHPAFDRLIDAGRLLEWAQVYGNKYGTPFDEVDPYVAEGWTVLLDVDSQGFRSVRDRRAGTPGIMIVPPSVAELERRIRERGTEDEETIRRRLAEAERELDAARDYDHVVVNDEIDRAAREIETLLERIRRGG